MVLEMYVAFLGAVFRCSCSVWSPLSIRNSSKAWKLPWRLEFPGSSSRRPLRATLFFPQKINDLKRDFRISRFLAICYCIKLFNCSLTGTTCILITLMKLSIAITEKLCLSHFPLHCFSKRVTAEVHSVIGDLNNLSNLFEFRPHSTPNHTHGRQNAPSRYLEYTSQGNLFSHEKLNLRDLPFSIDPGISKSSVSFHTFSRNRNLSWPAKEVIFLKTKRIS